MAGQERTGEQGKRTCAGSAVQEARVGCAREEGCTRERLRE
jgi:hypothetical protein